MVKLPMCDDAMFSSCPAGGGPISLGPHWNVLRSSDLSILMKKRREREPPVHGEGGTWGLVFPQ